MLLIALLLWDGGSARAGPLSAGDEATPTATMARKRSRLSMPPKLRRRCGTVDYLGSKLARALSEQIEPAFFPLPDSGKGKCPRHTRAMGSWAAACCL